MSSKHAYKDLRLQQLRGLCETARLGSLKAAAAHLGLAQPTVWEQVHALERTFGTKLIERHARGSRLTRSGRILAELAAPLVAGIESLRRTVLEVSGQTESVLKVAVTERIVVEDLPRPIVEFRRRQPDTRLCFVELGLDQILGAVESGKAEVGLTHQRVADPFSPWLAFEPAYVLDLLVITPKDHPLARRRRIRPRDLLAYPVVNAPDPFPDSPITAALVKLGIFRTQPRRAEATYTAPIRRLVELGFGIGLALAPPPPVRQVSATLHERSLSQHFGGVTMNFVRRKGEIPSAPCSAFMQAVHELLLQPRPGADA